MVPVSSVFIGLLKHCNLLQRHLSHLKIVHVPVLPFRELDQCHIDNSS